jgi:hypothetical protein
LKFLNYLSQQLLMKHQANVTEILSGFSLDKGHYRIKNCEKLRQLDAIPPYSSRFC